MMAFKAWVILICAAGAPDCLAPSSYDTVEMCERIGKSVATKMAAGYTVECKHRDAILPSRNPGWYNKLTN